MNTVFFRAPKNKVHWLTQPEVDWMITWTSSLTVVGMIVDSSIQKVAFECPCIPGKSSGLNF